jgi:ATP-dependent RNA helicase DOB1
MDIFDNFELNENDKAKSKLLKNKRNKTDKVKESKEIDDINESSTNVTELQVKSNVRKKKIDFEQLDEIEINKENYYSEDKILEMKFNSLFGDKFNLNNCIDTEKILGKTYFVEGCLHEVFYMNDTNLECKNKLNLVNEKRISEPYKKYEFKLDPFQQRATLCLENNHSVLVAAHTSAGKTVVAQYAIAKAIKNNQRVIYTSPIKALSNQKYRELEAEFKDVGLMTGDVTINSEATCLVMTTEILRNMLYRGSKITREMAWVIFDEVHYMRDKDRGVVWEETIILLPKTVKYVFLSATIPNAKQFSQWICKIKSQPCHLVSTEYRPVPLQHYCYASGGNGIFLVVNEKGQFKEDNFRKALSFLENEKNIDTLRSKPQGQKKNSVENDINKLIKLIKDKNLTPVIVFAFSKKDCEQYALAISKIDFCSSEEKKNIELIYNSAINSLSQDDQELPQIKMMLPLILNGVGIHHGGLLPIVKESVELLFQEGLIKVLFSTETFSMGINMPAKTVVFTNIEKWDGEQHRWLGGGEYIQMSGRAGRRGLDDKGITIMMLKKSMDIDVCRNMLSGKADPLLSSFRLSYNMIVNLIRLDDYNADSLIKKSFKQFQCEANVPILTEEIMSHKKEYDHSNYLAELEYNYLSDIDNFHKQIKNYKEILRRFVIRPEVILPRLCKGKLVEISSLGWGIVVNFEKCHIKLNCENDEKRFKKMLSNESGSNFEDAMNEIKKYKEIVGKGNNNAIDTYIINVLVLIKNVVGADRQIQKTSYEDKNACLGVVPVLFDSIVNVANIKVALDNTSLKNNSDMDKIKGFFIKVLKTFKDSYIADPIKDFKMNDPEILDAAKKIEYYNGKIEELKMKMMTNIKEKKINDKLSLDLKETTYDDIETNFNKRKELRDGLNKKLNEMIKLKESVLNEELEKRLKVLEHFDFIINETVKNKGQVACLVSSTDEIMLTEMLFSGQFNDIDPLYLPSVLSCFLVDERDQKEEKEIKDPLLKSYHQRIKDCAERVADILIEKRLDIDREKYVNAFKSDMMEPVLAWAQGKKFIEVCKLSDYFEGNIIRCIRRLDELIKQVADCAEQMENSNLKIKLEQASEKIKRGIIFAASLYVDTTNN